MVFGVPGLGASLQVLAALGVVRRLTRLPISLLLGGLGGALVLLTCKMLDDSLIPGEGGGLWGRGYVWVMGWVLGWVVGRGMGWGMGGMGWGTGGGKE